MRRTPALALSGVLMLGTPLLAACGDDEAATSDEVIENDTEELDDEGSVDGVGETGDEQLENDTEELDDEGNVTDEDTTPPSPSG